MNCFRCGKGVEHLSHVITEVAEIGSGYLVIRTTRVSSQWFHHCGQEFRGSSDGNGAIISPLEKSEALVRSIFD